MFDSRETDMSQSTGGWTPIPEGIYDVTIEEAGVTHAKTGAEQLKVKGKVDGHGTFVDYVAYTKASGEPIHRGRRLIVLLAQECGAMHDHQPEPRDMPGNVVRMGLKVETFNGQTRNRISTIEPSARNEDGETATQETARKARDAENYRRTRDGEGGGGNTEGADFSDDIPFIRMDGLPW